MPVERHGPPSKEMVFDKSEEQALQAFDSRMTRPDLIFLGVDENAASNVETDEKLMQWTIYKGRPYFALDVSQKGSDEQKAEAQSVVEELAARGITPFTTRQHFLQPPSDGMFEKFFRVTPVTGRSSFG